MTFSNLTMTQEAVSLLQESGLSRPAHVKTTMLLSGQQAQIRPLAVNNTAVSYLVTPPPDTPATERQQLITLSQILKETFSPDELQTLCFTLGILYEDLPGDTHTGKAEEIVAYMQRRQQLAELAAYGRQHRPHAAWPQITPPDIPARNDIAIVVSIAQPALTAAAAFLDEEDIPAHFVLLTNVPGYDHTELLDLDNDWEAVAKLFFQTTQKVRLQFPQARLHLFLAAPLSLCFLLGCTWGTVYQGDYLYHLHRDEDGRSRYVRVAVITRQLREI